MLILCPYLWRQLTADNQLSSLRCQRDFKIQVMIMMIMYHVEDVSISIFSMKSLNNKHSSVNVEGEKR